MATNATGKAILAVLLLALGYGQALAGSEAEQWQLKRLFHPTSPQMEGEQKGRIFIYDGLTDRQVAQAMRQEFDRVEFMMFINVIKTDPQGKALKDPETGEPVTEDDDC